MGCWNKTCGLSNLHITANSDVYVFVLIENKVGESMCYSTAFYRPLLVPFYSKYNDYGAGEDSSGIALPLIIEALREDLIEQEVGENQYHDIAVKKDAFNEELFFEAVHEDRLRVKDFMGRECQVTFTMFRKDIVNHILDNHTLEKYVGDGKGTTGYGNNYITYQFKDVLADVGPYLDRIHDYVENSKGVLEKYAAIYGTDNSHTHDKKARLITLAFSDRDEILFEYGDPNKVVDYMFGVADGVRYSRMVAVRQTVLEWLSEGKRAEAEQLLTDYLKGSFLDMFMHQTRKLWIPGGHEGSQSQDHEGYRTLIAAMTAALDREQKEYEEDHYE